MFDRRNVKVTSHMVGAAVEKHPTLAEEIVQRGHEPSGHGQTWTPQSSMTPERERKSYADSAATIERVTGVRPVGFNAFWSRSHMQRRLDRISACAVFALFLSSCARQTASADRAQANPISVRVAMPKHVRVPAEVDVSGTVETPSAPTNVGFLVSGKVIRVGPREGDFVKAGEVLAVVDPADFQFGVQSAIAQIALARAQSEKAFVSARPEQVEQARANLSQAEDEFRRMKTLYEKKSLAPNDFKKYETAYINAQQQYVQAKEGAQLEDKAAAKAALEQAEAAERIAQKRLSDSTLIAPIGGFVSKRNIEVGAMASPGTSVFTIVELDTVEIQVGVPETDVRLVHRGQQAIVTASARPGMSFSGKVRLVNVSAEPQTRTYMVRITVPNPKRALLVGMIAEARILGSETLDVLTLPGQSLVRDPQGAPQVFVYFPNEKRVYAKRVRAGGVMGRDVQITDGVKDSDWIVVAGQQLVREGSIVSAKEER
jgi:multidrug efflux pump subunit AcrA (membrane-fusion protein)